MAIVFSAIVPHSPILIPSIGKENSKLVEATASAFRKIEEDLYSAKVETIVIISPHGPIQQNVFSINIAPKYMINFEEFGDFVSKAEIAGDIGLAYKMKEKIETDAPLQLITEEKLDHGTSIPVYLLTRNMPNIKIIPVYFSGLDAQSHFDFGKLLKRSLAPSQTRIAVIASGDLSHRLTKNSPAGYSPKGKKFDAKITECLLKKNNKDILGIKNDLAAEAGECGLKSITTLLGILDGVNYDPQVLAYEFPFGVGYLTMNLKI